MIVDDARAILTTNRAAQNLLGTEGLDSVQNLGLLVAYRVRPERDRRLHRSEADELHDVVGDHIAQCAGLIVVAAPCFDTYRFGDGNLHMINVAAVPDRLENSIRKPKCQNVLDGFLAEVMVDPINLFLAGEFEKLLIQDLGGFKIASKWLFDNHSPPVMIFLFQQPHRRQLLDNLAEE